MQKFWGKFNFSLGATADVDQNVDDKNLPVQCYPFNSSIQFYQTFVPTLQFYSFLFLFFHHSRRPQNRRNYRLVKNRQNNEKKSRILFTIN